MSRIDIDELRRWVGRRAAMSDAITAVPASALGATLDRPDLPAELPPLWHWLYFLPVVALAEVGPDGHPARGGFLPPVPLPRRMWAAGRLTWHRPLRIGEEVLRTSEIVDVQHKAGKSGSLVFVTVRHVVHDGSGAPAISEEQDIVYRDDPQPGTPAPAAKPAPANATWMRKVGPDPVLLFRYSALTFNGHRIHYDRPYATGTEGYPGLVVHGPLIATLLLDHVRRGLPSARPVAFEFRAVRPLFDGAPFALCARREADRVQLWAQDAGGALCMDAVATIA